MSSNAYAALRLELQPSQQRRYWRWFIHALVIVAVVMLHTYWLIALGLAATGLSLYRSRTAAKITLLWHSESHWTLFEAGREYSMQTADAAFVTPWLVILALRCETPRGLRRIAIFPDMLPAQDFRRLRVRLRSERDASSTDDKHSG